MIQTKLSAELDRLLGQTSLEVSGKQRQQLVALVELLDKWNKAYNLTSVRDPGEMLVKHILDSIIVSPHLGQAERLIDVGTGPGLPGLPLAIMNPDRQFVLLDSLGKRIRFIRQVVHSLGLTNVTPVQSRVEKYHDEQGFDLVLSRAFASLQDMLSWCNHLPSASGAFLALKGRYPEDEIATLGDAYRITEVTELRVPALEGERHLIRIQSA